VPPTPEVGTGPGLFGPIGLALVDATSALITNNAAEELMSVDLTNGNRSVVSALDVRGDGPAFGTPEGVTMDTANNRALVTDSENNSLMAVNLASGDRTIISANGRPATPEVGTGPNFDFPIGVVLDSANNRALVVNNFSNLILAVDLATGASFGDRTIFSDTDTNQANGTGPVLDFASGIALDGKDSAFVSGDKLWAVELGSGDRVIVGD
jgi:DNA-binding beta-propeller fold protein YncE